MPYVWYHAAGLFLWKRRAGIDAPTCALYVLLATNIHSVSEYLASSRNAYDPYGQLIVS